MAPSAGQRYLAEFLGSFILLFVGGGSAVFTAYLTATPGVSVVPRFILISFSFGIGVMAAIYIFGDISGGHFNPAVTLAMWFTKRMERADLGPYLVAQILGGITGISVALGIVSSGGSGGYSATQAEALGSQGFSGFGAPAYFQFNLGSVLLLEIAITFVFVLVILSVTRSGSPVKNLAPLVIGLTLLVANLVALPIDGSSINPIRSFSPAVVSAMWPSARWAIVESWAFWVAPIVGGLLAAFVERYFHPAETT